MYDLETKVRNFMERIDETEFDCTYDAVEKIILESEKAKAHLVDGLFSKAEKFTYLADKRMFVLDTVMLHRSIDTNTCIDCRRETAALSFRFDDELGSPELEFVRYALWEICDFYSSEITEINARRISEYGRENFKNEKLKKFNVVAGQKRSKAFSKMMIASGLKEKLQGIEKTYTRGFGEELRTIVTNEYDYWFAKFGDAINTIEVPYKIVISVNTHDYITQSDGDNWSSCHNPNRNYADGCNCSGGISYALDESTIIMYALPVDYEGTDYELQKKCKRAYVHMSPDFKWFIMSGVYPNKTAEENKEFRQIAERVFADCLGVPNLWKVNERYIQHPFDYIERGDYATCYRDFHYPDHVRGSLAYLSSYDIENDDNRVAIIAGAEPICVYCGYRHSIEDQIECEKCFGGRCWSEYHDEYIREEDAYYCEYDGDYYYADEGTDEVIGYGVWVAYHILEESEDFCRCDDCGEWMWADDAYSVDDGWKHICKYCYRDGDYYTCDECGEIYSDPDAVHEFEGAMVCDSCTEICEECGCVTIKKWCNSIIGNHRRHYFCDDCRTDGFARIRSMGQVNSELTAD